ncbi:MAG: 4Fe-4S dicluster domain-containing protein [Planctomycetes bacterium]|nr:4Fe-4S dicluster domain-containing protein [Planctomycetota bacterium]
MISRRGALAIVGGAAAGGAAAAWHRRSTTAATPSALRPPGAAGERAFLAACIRCGLCVEACPFDTLHLADVDAGIAAGAPVVDARQTPCFLCQGHDEPQCIRVCPTEALRPVEDLTSIRMGIARVDPDRCLVFNQTVCRSCWHACPFPNDAIRLDERLRPVVEASCVGCGLCEHACPTEPSSIVVEPAGDAEVAT